MGGNATAEETHCFQSRMKGKAARVLALEARVLETRQEVRNVELVPVSANLGGLDVALVTKQCTT